MAPDSPAATSAVTVGKGAAGNWWWDGYASGCDSLSPTHSTDRVQSSAAASGVA